jgi:hypothetical protein
MSYLVQHFQQQGNTMLQVRCLGTGLQQQQQQRLKMTLAAVASLSSRYVAAASNINRAASAA